MDKGIIVYCTSGLGNRLRSFASAAVIAEETGRRLRVYWDNLIPNGCLAKLDELFENKFEEITLEEMTQLEDCKMCCDAYDADRENWHFKNPTLKILTDKFSAQGKDAYKEEDDQKNIVIFNNNFLSGVDRSKAYKWIGGLIPKKEINKKIEIISNELGLSKNVIGIHARGSDFGTTIDYYLPKISEILSQDTTKKFFVSTEDKEFENRIISEFPNNIIFRIKDNYISKENNDLAWNNYNSFSITKNHAQEAIEDMFLLAKTDIQIYHPNSTFGQIAKIISEYKQN